MNKYILCLFVAIFPSILLADMKTMKILDRAYINALDKHYQQAIDKALPLLDSLALNRIEEIVLAHQILTLSFCETGNMEKARDHLRALRAFSPNEDFRVFAPSPTCQMFLSAKSTTSSPDKVNSPPVKK